MAPSIQEATTIINWGSSKNFMAPVESETLNLPSKVAVAINKKSFFQKCEERIQHHVGPQALFSGVCIPKFWLNRADCVAWMQANPGKAVVCRTLLTSHEGRGIVLTDNVNELPDCKLYTEYIKKKHEYRVHIFNDDVIRVQQKKRKTGATINNQIRNSSGGWVFATENVHLPSDILHGLLSLAGVFELDLCAFDVIFNEYQNKYYVLEANTAPGIEGTSVRIYGNAIRSYLDVEPKPVL